MVKAHPSAFARRIWPSAFMLARVVPAAGHTQEELIADIGERVIRTAELKRLDRRKPP